MTRAGLKAPDLFTRFRVQGKEVAFDVPCQNYITGSRKQGGQKRVL